MMHVRLLPAALLVTACASQPAPDDTGPRAKFIFSSPYFDRDAAAGSDVSLKVLESNEDCSFDNLAGMKMEFGGGRKEAEVEAHKRAFFKLRLEQGEDFSEQGFSIVPEADREYLIQQVDQPGKLRIRYYVIEDNGDEREIRVDGLELCE